MNYLFDFLPSRLNIFISFILFPIMLMGCASPSGKQQVRNHQELSPQELSQKYFLEGRYQEAIELLKPYAETGDTNAMHAIGTAEYNLGNRSEATKWIQWAAVFGNQFAIQEADKFSAPKPRNILIGEPVISVSNCELILDSIFVLPDVFGIHFKIQETMGLLMPTYFSVNSIVSDVDSSAFLNVNRNQQYFLESKKSALFSAMVSGSSSSVRVSITCGGKTRRSNISLTTPQISEALDSFNMAPVRGKKNEQVEAPPLQLSSGSGFFVSRNGHVVTNAHVVQGCRGVTVGDGAKRQSPVEIISTDRNNDLALLKLYSLKKATAETKALVRELGIKLVPQEVDGLLRLDDVELGEKILVAGYPYGDIFSNSIKVTGGIVSAVHGFGDDIGQFQLDAAVQPGNSGGPIYDENGNIVGVVVAQLNKLTVAEATGSLPENVNFGIKASTVKLFLVSSGLLLKQGKRTNSVPTKQLAKVAKKQTLMVQCHR